ncbi:hypothetical protein [Plebeiibacterium sediminum]|uniref:Uncharacterized protein n=1 Tax=Plebeiibacterium sediminum TaxID=2992112 RepID=A0AAE3M171_9BACT|nr:hypothetical protein [Plebeiobacterium sediminum]MCW3784932.1 hypothetical protein [Plebeiobacterium sediminum]
MSDKVQVSFKVETELMEEFDTALEKFKEVSGIKPKKLECFEVALKDYIEKLNKQTQALRNA